MKEAHGFIVLVLRKFSLYKIVNDFILYIAHSIICQPLSEETCPFWTKNVQFDTSPTDIKKDRPYFRPVPFGIILERFGTSPNGSSIWGHFVYDSYLFSTFFLMNITPTPIITNADITIDIGNMKFMFAPVFEVIITLSAMSSSYSTCGPVPGI